MKANPEYEPTSYSKYIFKTTPYEHQKQVLKECWLRPYYAWFWEMGCVDADTEYHNGKEWVRICDYKAGDHVLAWEGDCVAKWVKPLDYIKLPCDKMYLLKNRQGLDQMISPEHRVYFRGKQGWVPQYADKLLETLEATKASVALPYRFQLYETHADITAREILLVRLLTALIIEGSFAEYSKRCTVVLKEGAKQNRFETLLEANDVKYQVKEVLEAGRIYTFTAPMRITQFPPHWYRSLHNEALKAIAYEALNWGGNTGNKFYTFNKADADFIQFAFAANGCFTKVSEDNLPHGGLRYTVMLMRKQNDMLLSAQDFSHVKTKDGFKYCFRVMSGRLILRRNGIIFLTGNSGKTKEAIDNFSALFQHNLIDGVLVVAPMGVYRNWTTKEIPEHMPDNLQRRMMYWQKRKKARNAIEDMCKNGSLPEHILDILVINIEALVSKQVVDMLQEFLKSHDAMMIIDESTRIKNVTAQRTKACTKLGRYAKYRRILTGSPLLNSPLDLYGQCNFLNPAITNTRAGIFRDNPLGFSNYISFRSRYAITRKIDHGGRIQEFPVAYQHLDELSAKLKSFSSRIRKEECVDLPEKIYTVREVPLTEEQVKGYNEMAKKCRIFLMQGEKTDTVFARMALTQLLKLQQISAGFVTNEDGTVYKIDNNRMRELLAVLDDIDITQNKVIIWSNFVPAIEEILSTLRLQYGPEAVVDFYGATEDEAREQAKISFQDPESPVRIFVGNPAVAGMGITLTQATHVIYYSNGFNLEHRLQSEDRAHRVGQTKPVTYIDLVSTKMDRDVLNALRSKKEIADLVVDGEISDWLEVKEE